MSGPEPNARPAGRLLDKIEHRLDRLAQSTPTVRWAIFALLAAAFVYLAAKGWRKWPEVLVDYGAQLYIPWQLSTGKVLYRDIAYLPGGPLSQYLNALLFKVFGVSFTGLVFANLGLTAFLVGLLYGLFRRSTNRLAAVLACLIVICTFALAQNAEDGNYNYVCPYSHEALHGLILSVAAVACLWRWIGTGRRWFASLAGFLYGCVFLTKPDLFLGLSMTLATAVFIRTQQAEVNVGKLFRALALMALGAAIPVGGFVVYFSLVWDLHDGLRAVANAWVPLLTTQAALNAYYAWCLGLDTPKVFAISISYNVTVAVAGLGLFALAGRHLKHGGIRARLVVVLLAGALYKSWNMEGWNASGQALLPLTISGALFLAYRWWHLRHTAAGEQFVFPLLWSVFALFLLAKLGLFTRLWHYGFYLAMPATTLVILLALWLVPVELVRFRVNPFIFRSLVVLFLVWGQVQLLRISNAYYDTKTLAVGTGKDRFYTPPPAKNRLGKAAADTIEWLRQHTASTNTLVVMPEGAMINYQSRRLNPTKFTVFAYPEVQSYGEQQMLDALESHRPDYVLLVHRESHEYGVRFFGEDRRYGYDLMQWVRTNYSPLWIIGHEPLKETNQFGVMMLQRNVPPGSRTGSSPGTAAQAP